ncbi:MAG: helix-hairpin-helix domain-containing protein, partial [Chloroflexi bacterium]|nr:helix-hairpin-helix domain-containing protein [Chloroflexota bacterium]
IGRLVDPSSKLHLFETLEDLYLPYRPKRKTRASVAREKGLGPLADLIISQAVIDSTLEEQGRPFLNEELGIDTIEQAYAGARDIVAEVVAEDADVRGAMRDLFFQDALLTAKVVDPAKDPGQKYTLYYEFSEPVGKVPPHRVLAINRAEREEVLRVSVDLPYELARSVLTSHYQPKPQSIFAQQLEMALEDSYKRLLSLSLEREVRATITEKGEGHAISLFAANLRKLLLQPPTRGRRVLAIDPGFKSGSKMVALDEFGNVLGHGVIFVIGKDPERRARARQRLADMVRQYQIGVIAIGNGTGCRETEQLVAECLAEELKDQDVAYVIVNEAGASIYSTSPLGREELPQYDALLRGAISIGRRLLDPLSEMVKIHPANLGVGLYQHDMKAKHLKDSLDAVVESCVNFVGVDVNSASPALLRYVSGMNALTARRVYEYRRQHGPFKNREELKNVPGIGEQTFIQAAGFLKILGGENPLDATWIHPESYDIARRVLEKLGCDVADLVTALPPARKEAKKGFAADLLAPAQSATAPAADVPASLPSPPTEPQAAKDTLAASAEAHPADAAAPTLADAPAEAAAATPVGEAASVSGSDATPLAAAELSQPTASGPSSQPAEGAASDRAFAGAAAVAPPEAAATSAPASVPRRSLIAERAAQVDIPALAAELGVGTHLLQDILTSLTRPGIDPRDSLPPPVFRRGIMKLEDLTPGMELTGTVLNVVDFGVFVDIGLSDSGLVHISRLADHYIRDPHEVVGVGDILKVWVVEVDKTRRRVSLTAIPTGTQRP